MDDTLVGFRRRPGWLAVVVLLLAAQTWITLHFFADDGSPGRLTDPDPVVSGRHALHLYHGWLGADCWLSRGGASAYDPSFQAGYPKTALFDDGCRPAEFFMILNGGEFSPAAYKIGLAVCCLLAPLAFVLAGRGLGLCPGACCAAGLLGTVLWWGEPSRRLLVDGELHVVLAGLLAVVHLSWLARFARWPGLDSWGVITITAAVGWYLHPPTWLVVLPVVVGFYLWTAWKQELTWHLSWFASGGFATLANLIPLTDWSDFWWALAPTASAGLESFQSPDRGAWDRLVADAFAHPLIAGVFLAGILGTAALWGWRRRAEALLAGAALAVPLALLVVGDQGESADHPTRSYLLALAGWGAVAPALFLVSGIFRTTTRFLRLPGITAPFVLVMLAGIGGWRLADHPDRLTLGLTPDQRLLVKQLTESTGSEARILWEEQADEGREGWTVLLPRLTGRHFLGGLGDAPIDHVFPRMTDGQLAGRPLGNWSDEELTRFCERYNVGWVVCRSGTARARWGRYDRATGSQGEGAAALFTIDRAPTYVLRGSAVWVGADHRRIALKDVAPSSEGDVLLSLHHQEKLQVSPGYVQLEREWDPFDPVPFIRLRVPGPVPRVSLTWSD